SDRLTQSIWIGQSATGGFSRPNYCSTSVTVVEVFGANLGCRSGGRLGGGHPTCKFEEVFSTTRRAGLDWTPGHTSALHLTLCWPPVLEYTCPGSPIGGIKGEYGDETYPLHWILERES